MAKIGPVDPEIICLRAIVKKRKKEVNASKIGLYSPVGTFGLNNISETVKDRDTVTMKDQWPVVSKGTNYSDLRASLEVTFVV